MLGIPVGVLTSNLTEWLFHKYVLHGLGKNKDSIWSAHWHNHHRKSRKNNMIDDEYKEPIIMSYETIALLVGGMSLLPLLSQFPWFVTTMWACGTAYYVLHRQAHLDSEWAKKHLPWHYSHHMSNQSQNWNVTVPIFDYILGTRKI